MASVAQADLRAKLRFERILRPQIESLNVTILKDYVRSVAGGRIPDAHKYDAGLARILDAHANKVSEVFSKRIRKQLPKKLAMTTPEAKEVSDVLAEHFFERSIDIAEAINFTTQQQMKSSLEVAKAQRDKAKKNGKRMSMREVAIIAGNVFERRLNGRVTGITTFETQYAAETAKFVEVDVLTPNTSFKAKRKKNKVIKEWNTQGDSKVRDWHLRVDSVQVPFEKPFIVGGQQLMRPGDQSLGATIENVINCRCSANYLLRSVLVARQDLNPALGGDLTPLKKKKKKKKKN